jgi:hypothetical protein
LLLTLQPWFFFLVSIGLFGLLAVIAYQKKTAPAFVILVAAVFSAFFVYLDHISEITATATSLRIKVREASDALTGLKSLALLTGKTLINLDAQRGSIGGPKASDHDQMKQQVIDTLRSIGLDNEAIGAVNEGDRDVDIRWLVWAINMRIVVCVLHGHQKDQEEWNIEFNKAMQNSALPPDAIQTLLTKFYINDGFASKALDEYRYFINNGRHGDAHFWAERDNWPTGIYVPSNPDGCEATW